MICIWYVWITFEYELSVKVIKMNLKFTSNQNGNYDLLQNHR